jgi:hypothetical protein
MGVIKNPFYTIFHAEESVLFTMKQHAFSRDSNALAALGLLPTFFDDWTSKPGTVIHRR